MSLEPKIMIAMSGGVDSAVSALAIATSGYMCAGGTMKLFDEELLGRPITSSCCSIDDVDDAKSVCHRLGISHYTINCKREFIRGVVDPFVASYMSGSTPNPCIACNRYLKFETLLRKARSMGFDALATGHYARIEKERGKLVLKRAIDSNKDQSYVLHTITTDQLPYLIFPVGSLTKRDVRHLADSVDMVVADKPESQDICFIEDGSVDTFISQYTGNKMSTTMGKIVDKYGRVLGSYNTSQHFTIGQRRGLGIAAGHPIYVTDIDTLNNTIVVGEKDDLTKEIVYGGDFNWISITPQVGERFRCTAKTRYNMKDRACEVHVGGEREVDVTFEDGVSAPASGQSIVIFDGDVVLGGGYITSSK